MTEWIKNDWHWVHNKRIALHRYLAANRNKSDIETKEIIAKIEELDKWLADYDKDFEEAIKEAGFQYDEW